MQDIAIPFDEHVIDVRKAAELCGFSVATLRRRIVDGTGPRVIRLSARRIGFRIRDLKAWIDRQVEPAAA